MGIATEWRTAPRCDPGRSHGPAANFDRVARAYRWMEWFSFGPLLWQCRCAFLAHMQSARSALILGDGDGRFTARLLSTNNAVRIDAIDASPAMLRALTLRTAANSARLRTFRLDARDLRGWRAAEPETAAQYDLIVTHFFLDCLTTEEARALAEEVASSAAPGAVWVVSEFAVPQGWFGRLVAQPAIALLYAVFGLLTGLSVRRLPDHAEALRSAGFVPICKKPRLCGLLVSELWRSGQPQAAAGLHNRKSRPG
jgi:SAM-dependent methyltransferase